MPAGQAPGNDPTTRRRIPPGSTSALAAGREQFLTRVFPDELADIVKRREAVGSDSSRLVGPPNAEQGLVGLALSGGGIRSATIALGAVQALARAGCLRMIDYLSTVSGGGYTGSMLSSVLNDPDAKSDGPEFPLNFELGQIEPPALRHLRSGSNYLAGGGLMSVLRLPAILLRGLLLNVVLILPYIMAAALLTFITYPFARELGLVTSVTWVSMALFVLVITLYPVLMWWKGVSRTWDDRNRSESLLTRALVFLVVAITLSLVSGLVSGAIHTDWIHVRATLLGELSRPLESDDAWKWAVVALVLFAAVRATKVAESLSKPANRVFLYILGLTAPLAAFATYLVILVLFARSPYLDVGHERALDAAAARRPVPVITDTVLLHDLRTNGLDVDETSRVTFERLDGTTKSWILHAGADHTYQIAVDGRTLRMSGTNLGRGLARKALRADSAARPDSVGLDTALDAALTRAVSRGGDGVLHDTALLAGLNQLGVAVDSTSPVAYDDSLGHRWWAIGPGRSGRSYRLDIHPLPRGLIIADADLGPVALLRPALPTTTDSSVLIAGELRTALLDRGASVDSASRVRFFPGDSTWVVRSSTVRQYRITLEGAATGLRAALPAGEFLKIDGVGFNLRTEPRDRWFTLITIAALLFNLLVMDVNVTSPHNFWRDRLSRVFLFRVGRSGRPEPNDALRLSELGRDNPAVPYHLVNTSLNLASSRVEDLPGRGSDFFVFSRRYVGSYATGYCRSDEMERADPHVNLGTAMAISSAAVAPNSGTVTVKPLVPVLTLLNVRQDYWAPNPLYLQAPSFMRRLAARLLRPGPKYLFREAAGLLHACGAFVNLSDGGHIENLAMYELLRRRCRVIVASDGEFDPEMTCASMATLIRYARIDLGIEIDIDTTVLRPDSSGLSRQHWTIGTIRYGSSATGEAETGYLLYVKSAITGDEAPYVADYRRRSPAFPHESTADQFFDEAQFEAYRALGYHAMNAALRAAVAPSDQSPSVQEPLGAVRDALGLRADRLSAATRVVS